MRYLQDWKEAELLFVWWKEYVEWVALSCGSASYGKDNIWKTERFHVSVVEQWTVDQILANYNNGDEEVKKHIRKQLVWILGLDDVVYMN